MRVLLHRRSSMKGLECGVEVAHGFSDGREK